MRNKCKFGVKILGILFLAILLSILYFDFTEKETTLLNENVIIGVITNEYCVEDSESFLIKDDSGNYYSCKETLSKINDMYHLELQYGDYVSVVCHIYLEEMFPREIDIMSIEKITKENTYE